MPLDPGPSRYAFDIERADAGEDLVGAGADLEPATILAAYRAGAFPMGLGRHGAGPMGWWSPDPRGVLRPEDLRVSRSLRRSCARLQVTVDTAFDAVVRGCADPDREGRWITRPVTRAYTRLHALGWAHSVEVWSGDQLVGGLYGIAIGGLFAGESMFHRVTDASKVALVALRELITADGDPRRIIDVQWVTPHLASLGVREVPRAAYLGLLREALKAPLPAPWR
ncbi:MAG: leucyl/phenylalanyl-tRNA--protein transferase [Actinomycetales bacterium]|uniref:Leucyl/phenylalanyl-tRNA--protein transferase n=1 Tax=Candidatus Phosphoribacter hodrii TaxID=2953743 RepID=A0A935M853_9MICO|nr:leucyl/phenylalanyl-tRNA--protein transferase [Candidatus Phosphoribacter hodrii]MBP8838205.1 leucyl/phenylalanyl-tRNA--protein transferase [Dermatophilaceae bacterium]MBK7274584.1 leucyl/phenylalanyl-tRNA--protein transferase [Candidatus Phosphoribacter hodrii]MBL0004581.1 leucyl/phenylalanyl-tRNA--protein transferase [Candidatus Phosphoribacter hodrii]HOA58423.1 leucyl/phenylalanyl-tRNA--protein transferase [Dermatophilaceae bacterium]